MQVALRRDPEASVLTVVLGTAPRGIANRALGRGAQLCRHEAHGCDARPKRGGPVGQPRTADGTRTSHDLKGKSTEQIVALLRDGHSSSGGTASAGAAAGGSASSTVLA